MVKRYYELDSLRGIAAMLVLIMHTLFIFSTLEKDIKSNLFVLSFLWNGHSAVVLFFILSGFVLTIPLEKSGAFNYYKYIIKRYCRIYLPYIIILCSVLVFMSLVPNIGDVPNLQTWALWETNITIRRILEHLFFLGEYNPEAFLMVIWSLVHEMRISIIFPLVVLLVFKINWKFSVGIAMIGSLVAFFLMKTIPTEYNLAISTNYFISIHYLAMFIMGSLIARNRKVISSYITRSIIKYPLIFISFILFNYPQLPYAVIGKIYSGVDYLLYQIIIDWIISGGAVEIVILALSFKTFSKVLLFKPIKFLGKISYSIYLVHPVVIIVSIHLLYEVLPISIILIFSFISTIIVSVFCYKYVEKPSINLGKYLTNKHEALKMRKIKKGTEIS